MQMNGAKIICLGTTPAAQRVMVFDGFSLNAVNRALRTLEGPAGKSINVAKVLKSLGEDPVAMGFLGGNRGQLVQGSLLKMGIGADFVQVAPQTRQCTTILDTSAGSHAELVEESAAVVAADFEALLARIGSQLTGCKAMIFSGSLAPGGPVDFYFQCARLVKSDEILTIGDARGPALIELLKAKPALIKPNRTELAATCGRALRDDTEAMQAMRELTERGARRVVVTDGKNPVLAFDAKTFWRISVPVIEAVNPIGAGDSFTAGLVSRLVQGDEIDEACRWGVACGAADALTPMVGDVDRASVDRLIRQVQAERI